MKLKTLFIGALMTLIMAPAFAQEMPTKPEDIQKQAAELVKAGDAKAVSAFAKNYKKNAIALTCISKAYLNANDLTNAQVYADKAYEVITANKKATPAEKGVTFITLGIVGAAKGDANATATNYQQAMYADPQNPDGYRLYATTISKSDPQGAIDAIELLRKNLPNYPVDLIAAEIANNAGKTEDAIKYYSKVKLSDMKPYQLGSYAFNLFMKQKTAEAVKIAEYGQTVAPRSATLNRIAFWGNVQLKNWDKALADADKLFNASDSVKIVSDDYGNLINALRGAGKYDEALVQLNKLANDPNMPKADQLFALKQIAQTYSDKEDYAQALPAYEKYMAAKEKPSLMDQLEFGKMCMFAAQKESNAAKKADELNKADQMFSDIAATEANKEIGIYYRAQVATMKDVDGKQGLAMPFYDQILEMADAPQAHKLVAVRTAIDFYANKKGDLKAAVPYAQKWKELDPENSAVADQVISAAQ